MQLLTAKKPQETAYNTLVREKLYFKGLSIKYLKYADSN